MSMRYALGPPRRSSERSASVIGAPGSVPEAVVALTVLPQVSDELIEWTVAEHAERYRIYWSARKFSLPFPDAHVQSRDVDGPQFIHEGAAGMRLYYRVAGLNGPRPGTASPIATGPEFSASVYAVDPNVTPALADIDGDGCLDLPIALGDCAGGFVALDLEARGLAVLFKAERVNRDSRFADFNGDGWVDMFTNVYSNGMLEASAAVMHLNRGDGWFEEVPHITEMAIRGFGETVVAADFNNDGHIDLFVPHYWHRRDTGRNWLLINDGHGNFHDVAKAAGLTGRFANDPAYVPEGAQGVDVNEDGWVDIVVQSSLFINNGDLTFTDQAAEYNIPRKFDEGIKLADYDLDGDFDFLHNDGLAVRLYRNVDGRLDDGNVIAESPGSYGYGLNLCDINGDGREDLIVARNDAQARAGFPQLFLNTVSGFTAVRSLEIGDPSSNDLISCADLNRDGAQDLLVRTSTRHGFTVYKNGRDMTDRIIVRVVGARDERNQQGRVVRVSPLAYPSVAMTRVVESGSGYMAQGDYDIVFAAPWNSTYRIEVRFGKTRVETQSRAGNLVVIRETGEIATSAL